MDVKTRPRRIAAAPPTFERPASPHRGLGVVCIGLGVGLVANSALGPLLADAIHYPWSVSMRNQAIGLEAVSLLLVAPVIILAGILALRGHPAAPVLAFGPAAYTTYMFLQYVIGPSYTYYAGILPLHLALFVAGGWRRGRRVERDRLRPAAPDGTPC